MIVLEKITLSYAEISLVKHKIICVDYFEEESLNVDKGIEIIESVRRLSNNGLCAVIHNVGNKYVFTSDALRFMGSQLDVQEHRYLGRAIVATNPAARLEADNFIKFYKPVIPTALFSNVVSAITWATEIVGKAK